MTRHNGVFSMVETRLDFSQFDISGAPGDLECFGDAMMALELLLHDFDGFGESDTVVLLRFPVADDDQQLLAQVVDLDGAPVDLVVRLLDLQAHRDSRIQHYPASASLNVRRRSLSNGVRPEPIVENQYSTKTEHPILIIAH